MEKKEISCPHLHTVQFQYAYMVGLNCLQLILNPQIKQFNLECLVAENL